jgi:hypothetical protein
MKLMKNASIPKPPGTFHSHDALQGKNPVGLSEDR